MYVLLTFVGGVELMEGDNTELSHRLDLCIRELEDEMLGGDGSQIGPTGSIVMTPSP